MLGVNREAGRRSVYASLGCVIAFAFVWDGYDAWSGSRCVLHVLVQLGISQMRALLNLRRESPSRGMTSDAMMMCVLSLAVNSATVSSHVVDRDRTATWAASGQAVRFTI